MVLALDSLIAARYQPALSLGFHIVLSCCGVALPALMHATHRRVIKQHDDNAILLAKK